VDILRHQLKVYVEDFRIETDERKKLGRENVTLKKELNKTTEERELLKNQVKMFFLLAFTLSKAGSSHYCSVSYKKKKRN